MIIESFFYLNIISRIFLRIFWWPNESIHVCGHISWAGKCRQERCSAPIIIYQVELDGDGVGGGEGGGGGGAAVALGAGAITDLHIVTITPSWFIGMNPLTVYKIRIVQTFTMQYIKSVECEGEFLSWLQLPSLQSNNL